MQESFKRRLIKTLGITLGIVLVFATVLFFLNRDLSKNLESIKESQRALLIRDQQIGTISTIDERLAEARGKRVRLETILPEKDQLIEFPRVVRDIARQHNINHGFDFGAEEASTNQEAGSIKYEMSLNGTLENIIAFLIDFESHPYFITMGPIEVQNRGNGGDETVSDTYNLRINGVIYTQ